MNYIFKKKCKYKNNYEKIFIFFKFSIRMGIGDWGLGIGDWGLGPIPNPQSPIPKPQSPIPNGIYLYFYIVLNYLFY